MRRRALLGLPLVGALAACGGDWDRITPGGDAAEPGPPFEDVPADGSAAPQPTRTGPGEWATDYPAATVGLVHGFDVDDAVSLLVGASPLRFGSIDEANAWVDADPDYSRTLGFASVVDGWTLLWEDNGFQGSRPQVAARLSRRDTFASMYWNVNAAMRFTVARRGRVVRSFDPFAFEQGSGVALPEEKGLDLTSYGAPAAELVLLSRITGLPVAEPSWLERPGTVIFGQKF